MKFPKYLSVKEVASILAIKEKTVYKKIGLGEIPGHFKLGSMHFFDEEELLNGLKSLVAKQKTFIKSSRDKHGLLN